MTFTHPNLSLTLPSQGWAMQGIEGACQASRVAYWPGLRVKMQRRKQILGFQTLHLAHFTSTKWAQEGSQQRVCAGKATAGQTGRKVMSSTAAARKFRFDWKVLLLLPGIGSDLDFRGPPTLHLHCAEEEMTCPRSHIHPFTRSGPGTVPQKVTLLPPVYSLPGASHF